MKEWQVWVVVCTGLVALVAGVRDREHDGPPSGDVQNVRVLEGGDAIVLWRGDEAHHTAINSPTPSNPLGPLPLAPHHKEQYHGP